MKEKLELSINRKGDTFDKLERLKSIYGGMDDEQIIIIAINSLYQENLHKFGNRLIPDENGNYLLQVGDSIIAEIQPDALQYMDQELLEKMLQEGVVGGFAQVIKSAVQAETKVKFTD